MNLNAVCVCTGWVFKKSTKTQEMPAKEIVSTFWDEEGIKCFFFLTIVYCLLFIRLIYYFALKGTELQVVTKHIGSVS